MPRAKANPDPTVESHTPTVGHGAGLTYEISAFRNGSWQAKRDGRIVHTGRGKLEVDGAGFGAPKYPSNRLQLAALEEARDWLARVPEDLA